MEYLLIINNYLFKVDKLNQLYMYAIVDSVNITLIKVTNQQKKYINNICKNVNNNNNKSNEYE